MKTNENFYKKHFAKYDFRASANCFFHQKRIVKVLTYKH